MVLERQDAAACRDLQVYRRSVPVLSKGHEEMAEFAKTQFVVQRLFHQGGCGFVIYFRIKFYR